MMGTGHLSDVVCKIYFSKLSINVIWHMTIFFTTKGELSKYTVN